MQECSVFAADVEAAEAYVATQAWKTCLFGALLAGVSLWGTVRARPAVAALAGEILGVVIGVPVAAAVGWWLGGLVVRCVVSRSGTVAAYAAWHGWWQDWRAKFERIWECLQAARDGAALVPDLDDVPPGMTRAEHVMARRKAVKFIWLGVAVAVAGMSLWLAGVMIAAPRPGPWVSVDVVLGAAISVLWSVSFALPVGFLLHWRRHRDQVARRAGAATMDEFMEGQGWEAGPLIGWWWREESRDEPKKG